MIKAIGKVVNKVRNTGYRKANREGKEIIKRSKYLLLKNKENLIKEEKLKSLLELNYALTILYILKDYLKRLWEYKYVKRDESFLNNRCEIVESKVR